MPSDVLILGGGVIGLSLAWRLAQAGASVTLLDIGPLGRESSWAGAGLIPPSLSGVPADDPLEQLNQLSRSLHPIWSQELLTLTGIDNEYLRCGAWYLAESIAEQQELATLAANWQRQGAPAESATYPQQLKKTVRSAWQPAEAQLRNPRHLQALLLACQQSGVTLLPGQGTAELLVQQERCIGVKTVTGTFSAEKYCLCAGAWTKELAKPLGWNPAIKPLQGQIALLQTVPGALPWIVNQGSRYLVPRRDGLVLIGSTEEDVGFDKQPTEVAIQGLVSFATGLCPVLASASIIQSWAGLRPTSATGRPWLGQVPEWVNIWIASGHHRAGLGLSTGTAVLLSAMLQNQPLPIAWPQISKD